jgi:hypothetical protein
MAAFLVIRDIIADPAKRAAFDDWYRREYLTDAIKVFGAEKAWRFWSDTDPSVHQATYQLTDRSAGMKELIAAFDRSWPGIPRSREIFTLVEERGS